MKKCEHCGVELPQLSEVTIERAGVTDPFLVQQGLIRPEKMTMKLSTHLGVGTICPKCGHRQVLVGRELMRTTIGLPRQEDR